MTKVKLVLSVVDGCTAEEAGYRVYAHLLEHDTGTAPVLAYGIEIPDHRVNEIVAQISAEYYRTTNFATIVAGILG